MGWRVCTPTPPNSKPDGGYRNPPRGLVRTLAQLLSPPGSGAASSSCDATCTAAASSPGRRSPLASAPYDPPRLPSPTFPPSDTRGSTALPVARSTAVSATWHHSHALSSTLEPHPAPGTPADDARRTALCPSVPDSQGSRRVAARAVAPSKALGLHGRPAGSVAPGPGGESPDTLVGLSSRGT